MLVRIWPYAKQHLHSFLYRRILEHFGTVLNLREIPEQGIVTEETDPALSRVVL